MESTHSKHIARTEGLSEELWEQINLFLLRNSIDRKNIDQSSSI